MLGDGGAGEGGEFEEVEEFLPIGVPLSMFSQAI